jgi:hypothetical protein
MFFITIKFDLYWFNLLYAFFSCILDKVMLV